MATLKATHAARPRRDRKTRPAVVWMDRIASAVIAIGGLGTIVAVGMVCVFLVWVATPLFLPVQVSLAEGRDAGALERPEAGAALRAASAPNVRDAAGAPLGWEFPLPGAPGGCVFVDLAHGRLERFKLKTKLGRPVEQVELADQRIERRPARGPHSGTTAAVALAGQLSWAVGDDAGNVSVWSLTRTESTGPQAAQDGLAMVRTHRLPGPEARATDARGPAAVACLFASRRGRILAVGHGNGAVRIFNATTERLLAELNHDAAVTAVELSPKNDALTVQLGDRQARYKLSMPHHDSSLSSLLLPVWYEGAAKPELVWQSSGGDAVEMKLSLTPLIFGTLKATVYSMLFGAPLAFLAAIYTSQFLSPALRAAVKPAIEFMASLPSVVLGIFAALLAAPWVEHRLAPLLCAFYAVPFALLTGAHLWQLLPDRVTFRWHGARFAGIGLAAALGGVAAFQMGPWIETRLFGGNLLLWLDAARARPADLPAELPGFAAWLFPSLLPTAIAVAWAVDRWVNPLPRLRGARSLPDRTAVLHLVKFLVAATATLTLGLAAAWLLGRSFDPRGTFVDTYDQRNALVVGFVMGFAIVPIIYTVADDALAAVPDSLKAASLGAGATQWQTTVRIVIPAAMGGLFSAFSIGLGRAVGETMIVLMAAGNTPIVDWNIFNGFRSLSANVAVEIPEAVKNSTHYRTLFLSALVLFGLTFMLNTAAELIRRRFRSRAAQ